MVLLQNRAPLNDFKNREIDNPAEYSSINIVCIIGQINDLAAKLDSWDTNSGRGGYSLNQEGADKKAEDKLGKATKDSCKITTEVLHGIMTQVKTLYLLLLCWDRYK